MFDILDEHRKKLIPFFKEWKNEFYLAGGTGLALLLGHRISVDFDFFTGKEFQTNKLYDKIKFVFENTETTILQEEKNTLTILADDTVKLSFFSYPYPLLFPTFEYETMRIASLEDIACMKLSAIVSRATIKDYVDLYCILQQTSLSELLQFTKQKFSELDENIILKSLVYFDDVTIEPLKFLQEKNISIEAVKTFLKTIVTQHISEKKTVK
jgi:hypothetical protein